MMKKGVFALVFAALFSLTTLVHADDDIPVTLDNKSLVWQKLPSAPNLQYSVLAGNPSGDGFFVIRLKMPKNYTDIVHEHDLPRYDTIISGAMYVGFGDTVDKTKTQRLAAGSFFICPAHSKHYGYTDEETVVQISGMGPWKALLAAGTKR